jgi:predicted DCC family thiol-disulfide oxidoreductase YuxK
MDGFAMPGSSSRGAVELAAGKQAELVKAPGTADFDIEVFYDGECPLCLREIRMLHRKDRRQRIRFVDIAAQDFDAVSVGLSWEILMARIHGRLPDGSLVEGVEVFRRLYAAVGFTRLVALTRLPGVAQFLELVYRAFAKHRLRLTGRCWDSTCELHAQPRNLQVHPE